MRRVRVFAAAVLLGGLFMGGTAGADRPTTGQSSSLAVSCRADLPDAIVIAEAVANSDGNSFVGVWAPDADPAVDAPLVATLAEMPTHRDGDRISSFGPIHDAQTGEEVGKTAFEIDVVVTETTRVNESEHEGNRTMKVRGMRHTLAGTGTGTLPEFNVVFENCVGQSSQLELWDTQPHAIQGRGRFAVIECVVVNEQGYLLDLYGDDLNLNADVYAPASEQMVLWAFAHDDYGDMLDISGIHTSLRTHDAISGDYLGDSQNDLVATSLGRARTIEQRFQNGRQVLRVEDAALAGDITFPGPLGLSFSLDECQVSEFQSRLHVSFPVARSSSGPVPGNDGPAGAVAVKPGPRSGSVQQRTSGAADDAEVPSTCEAKGDYYGPMGNTVWFSVAGTGGQVVLDTAGSDFDTVLAVYQEVDGVLTQVACSDDTPAHRFADTPQTRLALATEPGVRYLVQVGGFAGEHGRLALTVS